jgi:hypothetical protein
MGDAKLGDFAQSRFVPLRFDIGGAALDSHNKPCHKFACPNCHLPVPRPLLHQPSFFISIVGAPASGKSYFLASMIWQLRQTMARDFCMNFTDADPDMNRRIRDYESMQFMDDSSGKLVAIEKTDTQGDIYNTVIIDGQETTLAQPFAFTIKPMPNYPFPKKIQQIAQTVCLYDNAGESFLPGADHVKQPVTRHLATSDALLFLFDPTQDKRFRDACKLPSKDPQMNPSSNAAVRKSPMRQETVLTEMVTRIRAHSRLAANTRHKAPLIIVLTKFDAWIQLVKFPHNSKPWKPVKDTPIHAFNVKRVEENSHILRTLLLDLIPDLVSTAESFAEQVTYIAVSATGKAPKLDPETKMLGYLPGEIKPYWAEVPFFHAQTLTGKYCVPVYQ